MITVVNKYRMPESHPHTTVIYCGRGSALGNPFVAKERNLPERNKVCDEYHTYFHHNVVKLEIPEMVNQVNLIKSAAKRGHVHLQCFCAPLRCHCETIKSYVEDML